MGVVYKAEDVKLGRFVALKFLPENVAKDPQALSRFQREAKAASALNHPNICTVHEIDEQDGRPFIVMEYLDGVTLKHLIGNRAMELDRVLEIGLDVADALDAAHAEGIVHRDIKPANIFVTEAGAREDSGFRAGEDESAEVRRSGNCRDGDGAGRGAFDQPGQHDGDGRVHVAGADSRAASSTARTDLFSFGVVLYEMVTGTLPFRGDTPGTIFDSILHNIPVDPVRLNPDFPPKIEQIISKALDKDRETRYQSAAELKADLKRMKRDSGLAEASGQRRESRIIAARRSERTPVDVGRRRFVVAAVLGVIGFRAYDYVPTTHVEQRRD